jgi:hypothetical protein
MSATTVRTGEGENVRVLPRGYWEAKDLHDDLETEIRRKIARGYPLTNTIFEDTQRGVLCQDKQSQFFQHPLRITGPDSSPWRRPPSQGNVVR